jgi:hypothetical protein
MGFVAQELEAVIPESVETLVIQPDGEPEPIGETKFIHPIVIIAALINAVKELTAKVEALEP